MKMKQYLRGLATGIVIAVAVMSFFRGDQNGLSDEEIRERAAGLGMVMADSGTLSGGQRVPSVGESQESYQEPLPGEDEEPDTGAAVGESRESYQESLPSEDEEPDTSAAVGESQESYQEPLPGEDEEPDTGAAVGESRESYQESLPSEDEEPDTSAAGGESTDASDDGNGGSVETEEGSGGTSAPEEPSETQESASGTTEPAESEQPGTGESADPAETVVITIYPGDGSYAVARYLQQAGLVDDAGAYDKYLCDNGYDSAIRVGQVQIPAGSSYEEIAKLLTSRH